MSTAKASGSCAEMAFLDHARPLIDSAVQQAWDIAREPSAEGLHQLRVSMRSLQTLWWLYRPLLGTEQYAQHRKIFRSIARAAGKVRDYDILCELLSLQGGNSAVIRCQIAVARAKALDAGRETLSPQVLQTELEKVLWQSSERLAAGFPHQLHAFVDAGVAKSRRQLRKRIAHAIKTKRPNLEAFHDVRKAGKKARFLMELRELLVSDDHHQTLLHIKKNLKPLGDLNDMVASEQLLFENPFLFGVADPQRKIRKWFEKERERRLHSAADLLRKDWRSWR